jgi:Protein of unknown function (DUF3455)
MKTPAPKHPPLAPVLATCLVAGALLAGCAGSGPLFAPAAPTLPAVPANLVPPAGDKQLFVHHAQGVQIYRCASATPPQAAAGPVMGWAFVAPQANLYASTAQAAVLGTHGAGPHWQAADGSRVTGQVKARADAPLAGAIPWLLLATTVGSQASEKVGAMTAVTHIQRVQTVGGVAPATGCTTPAQAGQEARVPYTATYVYFGRG